MSGAPPYNPQSPTSQPRYPAYSPSNKNRAYYPNNDQFPQHPPQTPPAFPPAQPASLSRSPHYAHAPSPLPGTLPPLNGTGAHPSDPAAPYSHSASGTPQFPLPRPYSGSSIPANPSTYGHHSPSRNHHPSGRLDGYLSPKREADSPYPVGGPAVAGYPPALVREPRRASPPKETVGPVPSSTGRTIPQSPGLTLVHLQKPARAADPMSFASILSGPAEERSPPKRPSPLPEAAPPAPAPAPAPVPPTPAVAATPPAVKEVESTPAPRPEKKTPAERRRRNADKKAADAAAATNGAAGAPVTYPSRPRKMLSERDMEAVNRALAEIDQADKSDVESPGFEAERERYTLKGKKRALGAEKAENIRRKVC